MQEVVSQCLHETGARGISKHSEELALIGLVYAGLSGREHRRRMRETFVQGHPECGSVFLIFILPILISVISQWIARWIVNRTDLKTIQAQAFDALTELSPSTTATLTSISTPQTKPTEPSGW